MNRVHSAFLITMIVVSMAGCQATQVNKSTGWFKLPFNKSGATPEASDPSQANPETPTRMAVIWSHTVRHDVGQPPIQGFGARVYFYDDENNPVPVDGELYVYGYDETDRNLDTAADRKYIFENDKFDQHYTPSELGPSYSFWIPWEKSGGTRRSVALLPVFKDQNGKVLRGDMSLNVLKGKAPEEEPTSMVDVSSPLNSLANSGRNKTTDPNRHTFAGTQVNHESASPSQRRLRTTTISVPRSLGRSLQQQPSLTPPEDFNVIRTRHIADKTRIEKRQIDLRIGEPQAPASSTMTRSTATADLPTSPASKTELDNKQIWIEQLQAQNKLEGNTSVS